MPRNWVRYKLEVKLLSDAHFGSGSGGGGIDSLIARDRHGRPVIWASHVEGVLRDAARRLNNQKAEALFGRAGGDYSRRDKQLAAFTSLYSIESTESNVWRSTACSSFDNRAPKAETLRVFEYVPSGTRFSGEVELPEEELPYLQRLIKEVDALGGGRSSGAGRAELSLTAVHIQNANLRLPQNRISLLLRNLDPLCITATATPDNLLPSLTFIPGRTLLGAFAAWLIGEGEIDVAELLTSGAISFSDALPLPECPDNIAEIEVLPAPLSLQSQKPQGHASLPPWWASAPLPIRRFDSLAAEKNAVPEKLKRPEDDLYVYRYGPNQQWSVFLPNCRVRLRNGRPEKNQPEPSLFAVEQIAENTYFLAELQGQPADMKRLIEKLYALLCGKRWLRVGRGGAPVEVVRTAIPHSVNAPATALERVASEGNSSVLLTLTSDLLLRDEKLRWRKAIDQSSIGTIFGDDIQLQDSLQSSVMVRGFNGTSRLWRMPAAAIRRGSVFRLCGKGVAKLIERMASNHWLGERIHEGFGRFRIDSTLPGILPPGVGLEGAIPLRTTAAADHPDEAIAAITKRWFAERKSLAKLGGSGDKKPSLSQWFDFVNDLESRGQVAIDSRLNPSTAGGKNWLNRDAQEILQRLSNVNQQRALHARYFVRWLRAEIRSQRRKVKA